MSKPTLTRADDAEAAVLAAVMMRNDAIDDVRTRLDPEHFYVPKLRAVYEAMLGLTADGHPIDVLTLEQRMRGAETLGLIGGLEGVGKLADRVATSHLVMTHADLVRDAARRRGMRAAGEELIHVAESDERLTDDLVAEHLRGADTLLSGDTDELVQAGAAMEQQLGQVERAVATGVRPRLATPLVRLNDHFKGGWWPTWYVLVLAAEKIGKTAFALAVARCAAKNGHPVLFFSGEMPAVDLGGRLITAESDVSSDTLHDLKGPTGIELAMIRQAIHAMRGLDFHFACGAVNTDRTLALWRKWKRKRKGRHGLVVWDYLQKIHDGRKDGVTRAEELARASHRLQQELLASGDTGLMLAQLDAKTIENREGHRPRGTDLRETQAPLKDADVIATLNRPWVYDRKKRPDVMDIEIVRARHAGWPWKMSAVFDGRTMSFGDLQDEPESDWPDDAQEPQEKKPTRRRYTPPKGRAHEQPE